MHICWGTDIRIARMHTGTAWLLNGRPAVSISKRAKGTAWLFVNEHGDDVRDAHVAPADQAEGERSSKGSAAKADADRPSEESAAQTEPVPLEKPYAQEPQPVATAKAPNGNNLAMKYFEWHAERLRSSSISKPTTTKASKDAGIHLLT